MAAAQVFDGEVPWAVAGHSTPVAVAVVPDATLDERKTFPALGAVEPETTAEQAVPDDGQKKPVPVDATPAATSVLVYHVPAVPAVAPYSYLAHPLQKSPLAGAVWPLNVYERAALLPWTYPPTLVAAVLVAMALHWESAGAALSKMASAISWAR